MVENRGNMRLIINCKDACERNIKSGDKILCFNDLAEVGFEAYVTDNIAVGAVAAVGVYTSSKTMKMCIRDRSYSITFRYGRA